MKNIRISLADIKISAEINYPSTERFCKDYIVEFDEPQLSVSVLSSDISFERDKYHADCKKHGCKALDFSDAYFETLALYRKICDGLLLYDTVLFHGSALSVDGEGFVFTAKSGVGKSTHARLYREMLGESVEMINDDKPLIRITDGGAYAYGTPWCGKHRLASNISRRISAICMISRAEENRIRRISKNDAFPIILSQMHHPQGAASREKTFLLTDKLLKSVEVYRLECNTDVDAARVSYDAMRRSRDEN